MGAQKRLTISIIVLCLVFVIGAAGFRKLGLDNRESFYMAIITVTTLGNRGVENLGGRGEVWVMILVTLGLTFAAYCFSMLVAVVADGELRKMFGRRQLENRIRNMRDHYIVCGCGRMGQQIVDALVAESIPLVVIEISPDKTAELETHDILYLLGDASAEETLVHAGIARARGLVSVLGNDADNVYTTLTARGLRRDLNIVARAEVYSTQNKLMMAGANKVVCPYMIGARRITNLLLRPTIVEFVDVVISGLELEVDELEITSESPLSGKKLMDSKLRQRFGVMVIAIKKPDGTTVFSPTADAEIEAGDTLITIGHRGKLASAVTS